MTAYDDLMAFQRETEALSQVAGRLHWDQETMMPRGAAAQRSEEIGALEATLHARRTDPRMADWLAAIDDAALGPVPRAQMRLIRRAHARATRLPGRLASEIARVASVAQGVWAQAREAEDVAQFLPVLGEVVKLKREEAAALAEGGDPYDALLDDYEPGATAAGIGAMFDRMRPRLKALRDRLAGAAYDPPPVGGAFPEAAQMALAGELAAAFGYDRARGRIDRAVHPFSAGSGADVRITTRIGEEDPFNCLYSTIHEAGHAVYEQGIDPDYRLTPLGQGVSMGVHESQSRLFENQIARSRPFAGWLFERMVAVFGDAGAADADALYGALNRVGPGYIRTEADEVHYNLHIMMRFDLERALIAGDLEVAELEAAWNARFAEDFGREVARPSDGVLQDVHWSAGLFGYFPTYALGNVYAGCVHAALRAALPELDTDLAGGRLGPAVSWLRERIHRHGGLYEPRALIETATGAAPTEAPLLDYLDTKFGALYGV